MKSFCILLISLFPLFLSAQMEQDSILIRYQLANSIGESHHYLNKLTGQWLITSREWSNSSSNESLSSKGTAHASWINDHHFVQIDLEGWQFGKKLIAKSIIGFNNFRGVFNWIWCDNSSTAFFISEASPSADGNNALVFTGYADDPGNRIKDRKWIVVLKFTSQGYLITYYSDAYPQTASKLYEIEFTR